jgi:hypothetical protein
MQDTRAQAQIIRNRYGLSLSESRDSRRETRVQFKFTVSKNMDSWFIKQPKSGKLASDIGANSSTEESHGSPTVTKKG